MTRKIATAVAAIAAGTQDTLNLGNLDARRDWGFAGDYVGAMWRMLQHDRPDEFVIATGEAHSVREFCEQAFGHAGLDYRDHMVTDRRLFQPAEVDDLLGDPSKARTVLGWEPATRFTGPGANDGGCRPGITDVDVKPALSAGHVASAG